jgi:tetratricopeptide (TPR) repeat protein
MIEYRKLLENQIGDVSLYLRLTDCYKSLNRYEEAIKVCRESLLLYPTEAKLYNRLILLLQEFCCTQKAIEVASEASELLPEDFSLKLAKYLTLPILYETQEQLNFYHNQF